MFDIKGFFLYFRYQPNVQHVAAKFTDVWPVAGKRYAAAADWK